ncbi:MAG: hypothetical protein KDD12_04790 [Lewinella sp.]|nr:hypothetical protein [Lewinella sp.]
MTNPSSPNPKPNNNQQRLTAIAAVVIVALLGVLTVMLVNYNKRGKMIDQLSAQYDESEQLKLDLEKQYYAAMTELEEMRGSNTELNALIDQQKEELAAQKEKIEGLLANKGSLNKARKEIENLKTQIDQYLAEINQLREENGELTARNATLSQANDSLGTNLESQRMMNDELTSKQAVLVSEKEAIEADRTRLSAKVNQASVIKVSGLEVKPLKMKKSGKAVKRNSADNIDQIQICFNTTKNDIAEAGPETFLVRIINPMGETLALDELGSGVFTSNATGDQVAYTQAKEIEYNRDVTNICTLWSPGQSFQKGNYEVEIYNKGHLAGSGSFKLN